MPLALTGRQSPLYFAAKFEIQLYKFMLQNYRKSTEAH